MLRPGGQSVALFLASQHSACRSVLVILDMLPRTRSASAAYYYAQSTFPIPCRFPTRHTLCRSVRGIPTQSTCVSGPKTVSSSDEVLVFTMLSARCIYIHSECSAVNRDTRSYLVQSRPRALLLWTLPGGQVDMLILLTYLWGHCILPISLSSSITGQSGCRSSKARQPELHVVGIPITLATSGDVKTWWWVVPL